MKASKLIALMFKLFFFVPFLFANTSIDHPYYKIDSQKQINETSERNRNENVRVTVYDISGNINDNATVYFFSTQFDTTIALATDSAGTVSYDLDIGPWSTYAHNNTDNGTYIDLWDGGVFYTTSDSGDINDIELYLYPRNEYGFLIGSVRAYNEENDTLDFVPNAGFMIDDTSGNTVYYGITNVWGDIGTPLLPGQNYTVRLSYDGDFYEQFLYVDTTDTYYELLFQFGDDEGGGDDNGFELEINGFDYLGTFGDHYYYVSSDTMSWYEAYNMTETLNIDQTMEMYMVTISSMEENTFIQTAFDTILWNRNSIWIGLSDAQNEGDWEWSNGEELVFTNWNAGEPNDAGGEDFVELRRHDGLWNDLSNNNERSFIIEIELRGHPTIISIEDVPNDQGGKVYLSFTASSFDQVGEVLQSYGVMRFDYFGNDTSGWVAITSFPAIGEPVYTFEVPTLSDSTIEDNALTDFKVIASMNAGIFHSEAMSGYSIDNIAPSIPVGLVASNIGNAIEIRWEPNNDEDFQYYILERSVSIGFEEYNGFETIDTLYIDTEIEMSDYYYYRLAALDHAGNVSEYSNTVEVATLSIDPLIYPNTYELCQNYPNPFNPITNIEYNIPKTSFVNFSIFDLSGNLVRNMLSKQENPGYRSIIWDSKNEMGETVASGIYIYTIIADNFIQSKKMLLLK